MADVGAIRPWIHCASWNDGLIVLLAEAIRVAKIFCLAANVRAWTLCVVREYSAGPAVAIDFAGVVVLSECNTYKQLEYEAVQRYARHCSHIFELRCKLVSRMQNGINSDRWGEVKAGNEETGL